MKERIMLSRVHVSGTERRYIDEAFADDWLVPLGPHVDQFEQRLEQFLGHGNVVALSAGTAAIHLGLVMLGVGPGDEVICQSLTFAASANPVRYLGATPVFVDSEPDTMNMDPKWLRRAIEARQRVTGRLPKAIIPVHLYGMPAKIDEIMAVADSYGIPVLEDAAEGFGSSFEGRMCGTFGRYGVLSFNGNKLITTSGGGALICPDKEAADRVKFYSTQARENRPYYYHEVIGYNYRLSNISAAIGCGQMDNLDQRLERRRAIHSMYADALAHLPGVKVQCNPDSRFDSNFWLTTVQIDPDRAGVTPDELRRSLLTDENIETRLLWRPMHMQPVYADMPYYGADVSQRLFEGGLCLPSGSGLDDHAIGRVIEAITSRCRY